MTDQTPPRAPDAVPEAVPRALRAYDRAMEAFYEDCGTRRDVDDAQWAVSHAISMALRAATETRDAEIVRLLDELAKLRKRPTLGQALEEYETARRVVRRSPPPQTPE